MRTYDYNGLAGCVDQRAIRGSGGKHRVGLYATAQAGLDASAGAWATVCEQHGTIATHRTLATAQRHLPHPSEWCDACRAESETWLRAHGYAQNAAGEWRKRQ